MKDGFLKAAAVSPALRVADCAYNAEKIAEAMTRAAQEGARLVVFPELALCGYSCGDLLLQPALLDGCETALSRLLEHSRTLDLAACIGLPVRWRGRVYNCAAVICRGKLLGVVPKTHLPNYGEYHELRCFAPAPEQPGCCTLAGQSAPFGAQLLFRAPQMPACTLAVELCEDIWVPLPPSAYHAQAGATVIANLSASNETAGKASLRRELLKTESARLICGYVYADAGCGESTTDLICSGHNLITENGRLLAEAKPFKSGWAVTELDLQAIAFERSRRNTFHGDAHAPYTVIDLDLPMADTVLTRPYRRLPFVPTNAADRAARCEEILDMQAHALARRLSHTGLKRAVVGISGGLDSCLALLVSIRAMALLGRSASDVLAVTMPCFGTTKRTRSNAELLVEQLGAEFSCIDISATVRSHFADIGQPEDLHDATFENAQARARTYVLMDLANRHGGLVVGTGDLSELALGWATYNGDHMSMYGVNASVPKTLIRHIVAHCADTAQAAGQTALAQVLRDILATPVSPELLPAKDGQIAQITEDLVGPYELHDFILYHAIRHGCSPQKVFRLLQYAFQEDYDPQTLKKWLVNFYRRFFSQQFKRSCSPDGPKVGSVSLSPRGDWCMPSDAAAALWLEQIP